VYRCCREGNCKIRLRFAHLQSAWPLLWALAIETALKNSVGVLVARSDVDEADAARARRLAALLPHAVGTSLVNGQNLSETTREGQRFLVDRNIGEGQARSLSVTEFAKQLRHRDGVAALALRNGVEEHAFGFRVGFKGLVALACEHRHGCAFRQLTIQFDPAAHDFSRGDHHEHILAAAGPRFNRGHDIRGR
jgi:hypothetical protein